LRYAAAMTSRSLCAAVVIVLAAFGASGCQERDAPQLAAGDATALRAALDAYFNAANSGDASLWAALYTADAVMMPPNSPAVEGRAAIESWLAKMPVKISEFRGRALNVDGAGDLAYIRGTYSMNIQMPGASRPVAQQGKLLQVYARQPAGSWLLVRDMWSADAPPAAP
jgi:uncharacterized protein (TIGR02246 family)